MANEEIITQGESMPVDKTKKRDRINYRYNLITAMKIKKLLETGYFDDKTELLDEAIDALYYMFVLKELPPSYEVIVKPAEQEPIKENENKQ